MTDEKVLMTRDWSTEAFQRVSFGIIYFLLNFIINTRNRGIKPSHMTYWNYGSLISKAMVQIGQVASEFSPTLKRPICFRKKDFTYFRERESEHE